MAPSSSTAHSSDFTRLSGFAGGVVAVAAGLCWAVKALVILATGHQPPLLFELAPLLMALAVLALAHQLPPSQTRNLSLGAASAALFAAAGVLTHQVMPLPEVAYAIAMGGANLLILVGLVTAGVSLRRRLKARLPLALGLGTLPAVVAGGVAAAAFSERLLEVPLVVLGVAWVSLGVLLFTGKYRKQLKMHL